MSRGRQALIGAGLVALLVVGWAVLSGALILAPVVIGVYAAVVAILLAIERAQYKPILKAPPGDPWRETDERFVDPASGQLVTVWEEPRTGRRAYVASDQTR